MTRKQYVSKLQNYLIFLLPEGEISDILTDIEECFDAGAADGKTEEQVCEGLGDPRSAAKEIISERGKVSITRSQIAEKYVPQVICAALGLVYFMWYGTLMPRNSVTAAIIGIVLPLLMWLILERKSFFKSFLAKRTDAPAMLGAVMIFLSAPMFQPLANGTLTAQREALICFALIVTGLITMAHIMLIISIFKSDFPKWLCIVPAVTAGLTIAAAAMASFDLGIIDEARSQILGYQSEELGINMKNYYGYFGQVLNWYISIIAASDIIFMLWAVANRNALSVPTLYLAILGGFFTLDVRYRLATLDPYLSYEFISFGRIPAIGAIAAAVSLLAVFIARLAYQKKKSGTAVETDG